MAFGKTLVTASSEKVRYNICKPDGTVVMVVPDFKEKAEEHRITLSSKMNMELTIKELKCI